MTRKCGDFSPGLEVIAPTRHCRASTRQSISFARLFRRIMDARIKSGHDIEWAGGASPTRLQAAIVRRRGGNAELGFQRRDARLQRLVLLARQPRHVLDRLELLALDDVEVAQDFFGLIADHRIDLTLDALGGTGGVIHQAPDLVEKPIAGLGHLKNLRSAANWKVWSDNGDPDGAVQGRCRALMRQISQSGKLPCHVAVSLQSY